MSDEEQQTFLSKKEISENPTLLLQHKIQKLSYKLAKNPDLELVPTKKEAKPYVPPEIINNIQGIAFDLA